MINPLHLYHYLKSQNVHFYTGVPDSLMKHWLICLEKEAQKGQHLIAINEGAAVALAAGYHIRTGQLPLVYMQNSGLGNAINTLTSLSNKEVYSIPMLLFIGWRGAPDVVDEPQHQVMGRITESLLRLLDIPYLILPNNHQKALEYIDLSIRTALSQQQPSALLLKELLFSDPSIQTFNSSYTLSREVVLQKIMDHCKGDELFVCTTGKTAREFDAINTKKKLPFPRYFLSVGAMGHANQVALGMDLSSSGKIIMIDGDGALFMHMGTLSAIGQWGSDLFTHILINNGCHESVGGQPTLGFKVDFCTIAHACGYPHTTLITTEAGLVNWLQEGLHKPLKQFVEIRTKAISQSALSRPTGLLSTKKETLMAHIQNQ